MQSILLVINAGSSSIKFALFEADSLACLHRGQVAGINRGSVSHFTVSDQASGKRIVDREITASTHQQALQTILNWLLKHKTDFSLLAAGHRVVHGGNDYIAPVAIDLNVLDNLQQLIPLAPLHQPHNLAAIHALKSLQPDLPQVACFDTAFHHTQPETAKRLALPKDVYDEGVRNYGFHGLSYEYIASVLSDYSPEAANGRTVVAHLGQGASLCAMFKGKSVATTMTFTPLDGLPMGTRCGSIDPAVVLYLLREKKLSVDAVSDLLHHQSGLLGLSGISGDMKTLLDSRHPDAQQAIDVFVYRIIRELGAMIATIQGLDSLVFTAGIGEHSHLIREKICQGLAWLGVELDTEANKRSDAKISTNYSPISVWVIPTNEEKMIASQTSTLTLGGDNEQRH
ncbi:MAG TPA: acetate/propionate family kinase [Crenotrichaceae bacterium]|nr:acetate/propionate family kinase [Crenotrichaceae bacterium]